MDAPGGVSITEKLTLSVSEASQLSGLSKDMIRAEINAGRLDVIPVGQGSGKRKAFRFVIPRWALDAYVKGAAQKVG